MNLTGYRNRGSVSFQNAPLARILIICFGKRVHSMGRPLLIQPLAPHCGYPNIYVNAPLKLDVLRVKTDRRPSHTIIGQEGSGVPDLIGRGPDT